MDRVEQQIVDGVWQHGWFGLSVAPRTDSDDPDEWFTYTIGLSHSHGWPELICFGLASDVAHGVLTDAIGECEAKRISPAVGLVLTDTLNDRDALLVDASGIADSYFSSAIWYGYRAGTPTPPARLQVLWPDKDGNFPGEPDCAPGVSKLQTPLERLR